MNFHHKTRHHAPVLLPAPQQALPAVPIPPCLRPPRWVPTSAGHDVAPSEMPSRVFSSNIVFVGTRCRKVVYFSPPSKDGCLTVFRWIWSRLAEEWCRFFLVVSSQVVFVSCSGFESPNTTLKYTLFHQHKNSIFNLDEPISVCVSPSCNIFATRPWPNNMNLRVVKSI